MQDQNLSDVIVNVKQLRKTYGSLVAITNINFTIKSGESIGLVGPNGAGKTTLFRCLMGLVKIQLGNIEVLGQKTVINGRATHAIRNIRSKIGYVADQMSTYSFLTVDEYLHFIGGLFTSVNEIDEYIDTIMDILELRKYKKTLTKNLSRGNYQKLLLSSALIHQPELLLLDEPFVGLDLAARSYTKDILREFTKKGLPALGIKNTGTMILSSHILSDIEELCDRLFLINNGNIIVDGTFKEITKNAASNKTLEKIIMDLWQDES